TISRAAAWRTPPAWWQRLNMQQSLSVGTRTPIELPTALNQRWSLDFVSDSLADGRRFRILCIVDDFSRECLATVVDTSLIGMRMLRELDHLTLERATPDLFVALSVRLIKQRQTPSGLVLRVRGSKRGGWPIIALWG